MNRSVTFVRRITAVLAVGLALSGCGQSVGAVLGTKVQTAASHGAQFNGPTPAPSQFVTIKGVVTQLLPDTNNPNNGLQHQNFIVRETQPTAGLIMTVNNDVTVGTRVQGLQVGEALTIKGIPYHDPGKDGIHWTHHTNAPGDAGFIETPDGHIYQ